MRSGSGPVGSMPEIAKPGRRSFRAVQIVEARQTVRVQRRHVAGRLGDEDDAVAVHLEFVGPVFVREHHIPAVGDAHVGDAGFARVGPAVAVQVVEHLAVNGVRQTVGRHEAGKGKSEGEKSGSRHVPHNSQLAKLRILQDFFRWVCDATTFGRPAVRDRVRLLAMSLIFPPKR